MIIMLYKINNYKIVCDNKYCFESRILCAMNLKEAFSKFKFIGWTKKQEKHYCRECSKLNDVN